MALESKYFSVEILISKHYSCTYCSIALSCASSNALILSLNLITRIPTMQGSSWTRRWAGAASARAPSCGKRPSLAADPPVSANQQGLANDCPAFSHRRFSHSCRASQLSAPISTKIGTMSLQNNIVLLRITSKRRPSTSACSLPVYRGVLSLDATSFRCATIRHGKAVSPSTGRSTTRYACTYAR